MAQADVSNKKVLVAYFSRTGEQYGVGNIKEGNTAIIAKMIADKTGGDLFEIKPLNDTYPSGYNALTEAAKKEKQANARPEIVGKVENFDDYDVVFVGYPNWWGDMPMPVYTFLESYNFGNKKVHHFCTHEGSGGVKLGLAIYGHVAQNDRTESDKKVSEWLKGLGF
jgi:flavodoxin